MGCCLEPYIAAAIQQFVKFIVNYQGNALAIDKWYVYHKIFMLFVATSTATITIAVAIAIAIAIVLLLFQLNLLNILHFALCFIYFTKLVLF